MTGGLLLDEILDRSSPRPTLPLQNMVQVLRDLELLDVLEGFAEEMGWRSARKGRHSGVVNPLWEPLLVAVCRLVEK
jgi:hypothetical protein